MGLLRLKNGDLVMFQAVGQHVDAFDHVAM